MRRRSAHDIRFGQDLRSYRTRKGFMQIDVSVATDLHRSYISRLETGHAQATGTVLFKLVEALEMTKTEVIPEKEMNWARGFYYWVKGGDQNS